MHSLRKKFILEAYAGFYFDPAFTRNITITRIVL